MSDTQRPRTTAFAALRTRLLTSTGKRYWRGLEELADSEEFVQALQREFPEQASELADPVSRRRFLQLMGASLALAGASACTGRTPEKIVPYVRQPEEIVPGEPLYYASALTLGGYATGVLVESHMGRPTKIEGNPEHPASLGATDSIMQAEVLGLYDPDRSQVVLRNGRISTWEKFLATITTQLTTMAAAGSGGLRLLTGRVSSPTLADQIERLLRRFPGARWHQYEPVSRVAAHRGGLQAFGEPVEARYDFSRAEVVLTLDADLFAASMPGHVRYLRDLAERRRVRKDQREMVRLYAVDSSPSLTGAWADHRWRLRAAEVGAFARALAALLAVPGVRDEGEALARFESLDTGVKTEWLQALAEDLLAHRGRCAVVPGEEQPAAVHALAHALNAHLGNHGSTVLLADPVVARPVDEIESLRELVEEMRAGEVELLVILGGNPVYDAPADLDFLEAMQRVPVRVHHGLYADETAEYCHWHVPATHALESWGDARAWDGTITFVQPLIEPLYNGRAEIELLAALLGQAERNARDILEAYWRDAWGAGRVDRALGPTFERAWRRMLHDGLLPGSALPHRPRPLRAGWDAGPSTPAPAGLEVLFRPDPAVYDGRFANNGWLQETPRPLTKLTWDNAALLSPRTAERHGVSNGDVVTIRSGDRSVQAPVWVQPGHAEGSVTLHLGYGRRRTGRVGRGAGFDAYRLRTSAGLGFDTGFEIAATGARYPLASTQLHHSMQGRDLVRVGELQEFREHGTIHHPHAHEPGPEDSLLPPWKYEGHSWAMEIDLNLCVGCNGCVTACQAENNIPIVGKDQVANGREMHWIRIDRYYGGSLDEPETVFQPVTCMHCDNAPCEVVCPVAATVHGSEGLNEMVYNRCVGTRYCANNCPYKVRRFNFLDYADVSGTPELMMQHNPDVTVRSRGVMEKCTYCVQRINRARQEAKIEGRELRDGDVVTACQQACPAQAIVFGDVNDPDSEIARVRAEPLHYGLLVELGTRPRTNYLARLRNPNPAIRDQGEHEVGHA